MFICALIARARLTWKMVFRVAYIGKFRNIKVLGMIISDRCIFIAFGQVEIRLLEGHDDRIQQTPALIASDDFSMEPDHEVFYLITNNLLTS